MIEKKLPKARIWNQQVKIIDQRAVDINLKEAINVPKYRLPILLNDSFDEEPQRFVNCLTEFSYVRPHNHNFTGNWELMSWLSGVLDILFFDEEGRIINKLKMSEKDIKVIEIPPTLYHTFITPNFGSYLEVRNCTYEPLFDRTYAKWAISEDDADDAQAYLKALKKLKKGDNANAYHLLNKY